MKLAAALETRDTLDIIEASHLTWQSHRAAVTVGCLLSLCIFPDRCSLSLGVRLFARSSIR